MEYLASFIAILLKMVAYRNSGIVIADLALIMTKVARRELRNGPKPIRRAASMGMLVLVIAIMLMACDGRPQPIAPLGGTDAPAAESLATATATRVPRATLGPTLVAPVPIPTATFIHTPELAHAPTTTPEAAHTATPTPNPEPIPDVTPPPETSPAAGALPEPTPTTTPLPDGSPATPPSEPTSATPPPSPVGEIAGLAWVEDGLSGLEGRGVALLVGLASTSRQGFRRLMLESWLKDGLTQVEVDLLEELKKIAARPSVQDDGLIADILLLPFLETVESSDLVEMAVFRLPWVEDGIGLDEKHLLRELQALAVESPELLEALMSLPWVMEGPAAPVRPGPHDTSRPRGPLSWSDFAYVVRRFRHMIADRSGDESSALRIAKMPFLHSLEAKDIHMMEVLIDAHRTGPSGLSEFLSLPLVNAGITDALVLVAVYPPTGAARVLPVTANFGHTYDVLRKGDHIESKTISLPLAGETNITVIHMTPAPSGEDLITTVEDIALTMEGFLQAPFPSREVVISVVDASSSTSSFGSYITVARRSDGSVPALAHEMAHYYFNGNFRQTWMVEGGAEFMSTYVRDRMGVQPYTDRKVTLESVCTGYENIRHMEYTRKFLTRWDQCHYFMGEALLLGIFEVIGEEAMGNGLKELYQPSYKYSTSLLREDALTLPTDEELYLTFAKHTSEDRKEVLLDLFRSLHGGAFAFSVKAFEDDHGDGPSEATDLTVGQVAAGTLDYVFDFDYFRFQAEKGQSYRMSVLHHSLPKSSITVYDWDGKEQQLRKWKARRRAPSGPEIIWIAPDSDEYYFAVQNFGGDSGTYTATVASIEGDAEDEEDSTADISLDQVVRGVIEEDHGVDYFTIELEKDGLYRLEVKGETLKSFCVNLAKPGWVKGRCYDPEFDPEGNISIEWDAQASKVYQVEVTAYKESVGTYTVAVAALESLEAGGSRDEPAASLQ